MGDELLTPNLLNWKLEEDKTCNTELTRIQTLESYDAFYPMFVVCVNQW